jgi:hypothetical protein
MVSASVKDDGVSGSFSELYKMMGQELGQFYMLPLKRESGPGLYNWIEPTPDRTRNRRP